MSGPTICIGGVCIPVYALIPIALIVLQNVWEYIRKNMLGIDDDKVPDNTRVIHVSSVEQWQEQLTKAKDTKRSLVVDFSATWCGPCRYISPIYHDLSTKYPCTIFLKVDVDEMKSIARASGVTAMPTFHFFRNGAKCDEMRGADRKSLEERIQKHYVEVELPEEERPQPLKTETGDDAEGLRQRKPAIIEVASEEQWEELLEQNRGGGKVLIADFCAPWSKPSADMEPVFAALSVQYPSAVFCKVDVDELEDVMNACKVSSLPTFAVFKRGEVVDELTGSIRSALESLVAKHA